MEPQQTISVKEARKLLGKKYGVLSDEQIVAMTQLLNIVAVESIKNTVPKS